MLRFDWKYLQNLAQDGGSDGEVSPGIKFGHCSVWLRIFLGLGKSDHRKSPGTHIFSQSLADGRNLLGMPYRGLSAEHVVTPMQAHRQGTQQDPPTSDTTLLASLPHVQGSCMELPTGNVPEDLPVKTPPFSGHVTSRELSNGVCVAGAGGVAGGQRGVGWATRRRHPGPHKGMRDGGEATSLCKRGSHATVLQTWQ